MAALARACLVAIIAFAAASFFLSDGNDVRFWLLLALGPIMYGVAVRLPGRLAKWKKPVYHRNASGRDWAVHGRRTAMPTKS